MSSGKSILIVTDFPYLPSNEGNRRRLLDIVEFYQSNGITVSCLYLGKEGTETQKMRTHLEGRLFVFPHTLKLRAYFNFQRAKSFIGHLLKTEFLTNFKPALPISRKLKTYVERLLEAHKFDAIQIEYLYLKEAIPKHSNQYKIVDTHDVMGRRWRAFRSRGLLTTWYSISEAEEKAALAAFDCVLAISNKDAKVFNEQYSLPNVKLLDFIHPIRPIWNPGARGYLFVGSNNRMNRSGLQWFIDSVLPLVLKQQPSFELLVAGSVGSPFIGTNGIKVMGVLDDLDVAYTQARMVVNPVSVGTGLPVKTLEALSLGIPVISLATGARGFEDFVGKGLFLCRDANEFADCILTPQSDPTSINATAADLGTELNSRQAACKRRLEELVLEM